MKFLLSLLLTLLSWPLIDIAVYGGIPSEFIWTDIFVEEPLLAIGVSFVILCIWYGIIYSIASSRKRKRLAPLMARELPWRIENDDDVFALAMRFGGTTSSAKEHYRKMRTFIQPGESLYFITTLASIHVGGVDEPLSEAVIGDVFLSDQRVLLRYGASEEMISFPLQDMTELAFHEKVLSFSTEKTSVTFTAILAVPNAQAVYNAFAQAAREAGVVFVTQTTEPAGGETITQTKTTVDCPGCGAVVHVMTGQAIQCEYCGRFVRASDMS